MYLIFFNLRLRNAQEALMHTGLDIQEFKILVDVARYDPDVLATLDEIDATCLVHEILRREMLGTDVLIRSAMDSAYPGILVLEIVSSVINQPDKLYAAAKTLCECDGDILDDCDLDTLLRLFNRADLFSLLAEKDSVLLGDCETMRLGELSAEPYFRKQVERFAMKGDFLRAWDTAKLAYRGYYRKDKTLKRESMEYISDFSSDYRPWSVSLSVLGELIQTIYRAMASQELVAADIPDDDTIVSSSWHRGEMVRYSKPRMGGKKPQKPAKVAVDRAGCKYARLFLTGNSMAPEGIMVLRIAEYLVQQDLLKARQKWRDQCADFGFNPDLYES